MARTSPWQALAVAESCLSCPVREDRLFCDLPAAVLEEQDALRQTASYPKGALLFRQGAPPRGIYVICSGSVKLTATSSRGTAVIMEVVESGDVLGLSATLAGSPYEASAETLEPIEASFLRREPFLDYLRKHSEVALRVAEQLNVELRRSHQHLVRLALAPNARGKLAGLLLEWSERRGRRAPHGLSFRLLLTHEEIGELIGTSRETVTRLLGELRKQGVVEADGYRVTILDSAKLHESFL